MTERNQELFNKEKALLNTFLEHGAIDRKQYIKSLTTLMQKFEIKDYTEIEGEPSRTL